MKWCLIALPYNCYDIFAADGMKDIFIRWANGTVSLLVELPFASKGVWPRFAL